MTYTEIDTIPAKLFYKIVETGDVTLLSDEEKSLSKLQEIWEKIKAQDEKNNPNSKQNKITEINSEIESYLAKLKFIKHAVYYLENVDLEDEELKELLKNEGYTYETKEELQRILIQSDSILDKVDRLKLRLPKQDQNQKATPFDEMVLLCGVISEAGFIDTNKITKTQLDGLINITNTKIKSLKSSNTTNGKRR